MGSPRATHSMSTLFLHASLIGPKCVQSSLQRESCVSTEQPHGLSPSQSTWPKYQATNSRVLSQGGSVPTAWQKPSFAQHSPGPGRPSTSLPSRNQDIALSPTDTGSGLGSVLKALITAMQHVLVTHLLPILC